MYMFLSSDKSFITGNLDGSVSKVIGNKVEKTEKLTERFTKSPLVAYINNEIVVAMSNGQLLILNENLGINKTFTSGNEESMRLSIVLCLSGNSRFIATADTAGFVRYFRRNGIAIPKV